MDGEVKGGFLNSLTDKYYRNWNQYKVSGVAIELYPLPSDVPILEDFGYNPLVDAFSVKFITERERREIKLDETVSILQDDRGHITGVNVYGVKQKGIEQIEVTVKKQLGYLLSSMREKMDGLTDRVEAYRELGRFDSNQRAVNFLEEFTEENLEKITT